MTANQPLSDAQRLDYLRLTRTGHIGPVTFRNLMAHYRTPTDALEALPELARRGGGRRTFRAYPKAQAEKEMEQLTAMGGCLRAISEPEYPAALKALNDAPPVLMMRGALHLLQKPTLAIVGGRNASGAARKLATVFGETIGAAGYVIVSGLARGIDTAAHAAALPHGTIAVLAGGVDNIYPEENTELYHAIAEQGLLVSESPMGTQPLARHFPRRNRIISGVALGVVVIEAKHRSGSLITAQSAAQQGREVMAAPGSPMDPRSAGSNTLIKDGAHLVQSADDVLHVLGGIRPAGMDEAGDAPPPPTAPPSPPSETERNKVVSLLGPTPMQIDELVEMSGLPLAKVLLILLELEIAGRLERLPGQEVSLQDGDIS